VRLVSLGIVGVLIVFATTVALLASDYVGKGQDEATRSSIKNVLIGLKLYRVSLGEYPDNLDTLLVRREPYGPGPFIDAPEIPKDGWGRDLRYQKEGGQFLLCSAGPDGLFDTPDDIAK
jgi:hypothetical protein